MRLEEDNGWKWVATLCITVSVVLGAATFGWVWWDAALIAIERTNSP